MLCLIARETMLQFAALIDVVSTSADAPFWVVAFARQGINLVGIDGHHLSHTDMA
jgi:hypothetical protein